MVNQLHIFVVIMTLVSKQMTVMIALMRIMTMIVTMDAMIALNAHAFRL
jgi:hypothetical protein